MAVRKGQPREQAEGLATELALPVFPFDAATAAGAARLLVAHRRHDLSLGDCACLATARQHGLPVMTADRAWAGLDLGVEIRLIR